MEQVDICSAILDSLVDEVVFADTDHIIRYMNRAGKKHYASRGGAVGKSLFDCHNEKSMNIIKDIFSQLQSGVDEILFLNNDKHRVYMRAVRDYSGKLIGYYERYAPPQ